MGRQGMDGHGTSQEVTGCKWANAVGSSLARRGREAGEGRRVEAGRLHAVPRAMGATWGLRATHKSPISHDDGRYSHHVPITFPSRDYHTTIT